MYDAKTQESFAIKENIFSLNLYKLNIYPTEYRACCPFCQTEESNNPAFSIYLDWHYFCHACLKYGDLLSLSKELGKSLENQEIFQEIPERTTTKKEIDIQKIYSNSEPISKEKLGNWLKMRGFNATQIFHCLNSIDLHQTQLKYKEYKGEKALIAPIISLSGICGIERINIEKDKTKPDTETWNKKALGKKSGFLYIQAKNSNATIITESLANAFVNALMNFNSIVTFGINNTKNLPEIISCLQTQGQTVYYWPDSLGIEKNNETKEGDKFFDVIKKNPDLLGILWPYDVKKNYDVNDLLISIFEDQEKDYQEKEKDFKEAFQIMLLNAFTYTGYINEQIRLKEIEDIKAIKANKITIKTELWEAFQNEEKIKIISASTGLGKTRTACQYMVDLFNKGEKVTFFCSTLNDAENPKDGVIAILKGILAEEFHKEIDLVVSKTMELEENQEIKKGQKRKIGKIAVTTYGYLGFKGDMNQAYSIAKELIENRIVICDEIQELWHKSLIMYELASNYFKVNDGETTTYKQFTKCPKTSRKGSCKGCRLAFKREAANGNPKTRDFSKSIQEKGFEDMEKMPEMEIFQDCINADSYSHIISSLFYKPLKQKNTIKELYEDIENLYIKQACNYKTWLETLIRWLYNPHIRTEFATIKIREEIKAIDRQNLAILEDMNGIKFPTQPCSIPFLSGRLLLHFLQLMKSKQVTFMSATIPSGIDEFLGEISKELFQRDIKKFVIEEIPYKFNITLLKTSKRLSLDKQAEIIKKFSDDDIFICTARKYEAELLYEDLRRLKDVALFYRKDWITNNEETKCIGKNTKIKKIITYARSAITRGSNFPNICLVIIDCNQYIPQAALDQINPLLTQQEIKNSMTKEIQENLTQIAGRFLRSLLKRKKGKTIIDNRNIVLLLHGLPDSVQDFSIDSRLLNSYTEYRNEQFLSCLPRYETESCIESLQLAKQGFPISDRRQKDHDHIFQKAIEKGLDSIHSDDRALLYPDDLVKINKARIEAKEKAKALSIDTKLKGLKNQGKTWSNVYISLHIARLSKIEQSRLKSLWKKL